MNIILKNKKSMENKQILSQQTWTSFFDQNGSPSFLQSWEWGELQKKLGYKIERIGLYDNTVLKGIALLIKIRAKRGSFLFIPHGPIILNSSQNSKLKTQIEQKIISKLFDYLKIIAIKEKFDFIRIAPILIDTKGNKQIFQNIGFKDAPIYMHAERIWLLDITKNEDELLSQMRKTTRYLIRKAPKDGITIIKKTSKESVDDFWKLYEKTALREHFIPFSKQYITDEFTEFARNNNAVFFFAKKGEEYLASALIDFTKSTGFYHQGASVHTKYPAPYLLQWEAIKESKKRGCKSYNFWGILQPGRSPKNWQGLTMFKQGFGGFQTDYVTTQDYIISPTYYLSYTYELYLKWKRGV